MNKWLMKVLLIALVCLSSSAYCIDGDLQYSAPYIWVNPETGQIETVNPGPQPKKHVNPVSSVNTQPIVATFDSVNTEITIDDIETVKDGLQLSETIKALTILGGAIVVFTALGMMVRRSIEEDEQGHS